MRRVRMRPRGVVRWRAADAMAKKTSVAAPGASTCETPSQLRAHIDNCVEWILAPNGDAPGAEALVRQPMPFAVRPQPVGNTGADCDGAVHHAEGVTTACYLCKTIVAAGAARVLVVNPFARASDVLLCGGCDAQLRERQ